MPTIKSRRRRSFLATMAGSSLIPMVPGLAFGATGTATPNRFVLVILRGAMDGLAAVQPYGDKSLASLRPGLLVEEQSLYKLDSFFGLHPALETLAGMYARNEASIYHALATPYRDRSHFDGQNVLETGLEAPDQGMSGWLNRTVPYLDWNNGSAVMGIGQNTPKILDGQYETTSWAPAVLPEPPDSTLERLQRLYARDAFLGERYMQGLAARDLAMAMAMETGSVRRRQDFAVLARTAGQFLSADGGPAIAVLESSGWDTHANQGAAQGQLANALGGLDRGLGALEASLGAAWQDTMVLVLTEFGRTAAGNGTGGTDHGTASAAFLLGGAVNGGRIIADWPGLNSGDLLEGRDLRPTLDSRDLIGAVLHQHLGVARTAVENEILPGHSLTGLAL